MAYSYQYRDYITVVRIMLPLIQTLARRFSGNYVH
jgi:hypothetical protein